MLAFKPNVVLRKGAHLCSSGRQNEILLLHGQRERLCGARAFSIALTPRIQIDHGLGVVLPPYKKGNDGLQETVTSWGP